MHLIIFVNLKYPWYNLIAHKVVVSSYLSSWIQNEGNENEGSGESTNQSPDSESSSSEQPPEHQPEESSNQQPQEQQQQRQELELEEVDLDDDSTESCDDTTPLNPWPHPLIIAFKDCWRNSYFNPSISSFFPVKTNSHVLVLTCVSVCVNNVKWCHPLLWLCGYLWVPLLCFSLRLYPIRIDLHSHYLNNFLSVNTIREINASWSKNDSTEASHHCLYNL